MNPADRGRKMAMRRVRKSRLLDQGAVGFSEGVEEYGKPQAGSN
jgi:hypothetical protein